jgi:hypothetical protein
MILFISMLILVIAYFFIVGALFRWALHKTLELLYRRMIRYEIKDLRKDYGLRLSQMRI